MAKQKYIIRDFSGGMNTKRDPRDLAENESSLIVKALEDGYKDKKLDKAEKDKIMKEALDVAKAFVQSKWKLW